MRNFQRGLAIGISVGVVIGVVLAMSVICCIRYRRKRSDLCHDEDKVSPRAETIPIRAHGADSSTMLSDSHRGQESPRTSEWSNMPQWLEGLKRKSVASACGIPKELERATYDFTTNIGHGAFGPVFKAQMKTGQTAAVKVLANDSRQGAMEFLSEKKENICYVYMSNGSLASHLYNEKHEPLSWDLRVRIALDVARGLEYLHHGAVPPVVHRDIKSSNILLDRSMKPRVSVQFSVAMVHFSHLSLAPRLKIFSCQTLQVADFGLSRQKANLHSSNVKGTFGYVDPECMSTLIFTKRSHVYSFGELIFEIMSGKNPQQGPMEYVELAAIDVENDVGWEEIADPRLQGTFDVQQLNHMAALAYTCINPVSRKRPSMRDIVLTLSETHKPRNSRVQHGQNHLLKQRKLLSNWIFFFLKINFQTGSTRDC
ncbi:hypothetical protein POUND7_002605 [Theobroma cacao]